MKANTNNQRSLLGWQDVVTANASSCCTESLGQVSQSSRNRDAMEASETGGVGTANLLIEARSFLFVRSVSFHKAMDFYGHYGYFSP